MSASDSLTSSKETGVHLQPVSSPFHCELIVVDKFGIGQKPPAAQFPWQQFKHLRS